MTCGSNGLGAGRLKGLNSEADCDGAGRMTLDSKNNNRITSVDAAFGTLRIWRDLDLNGVTDAGELRLMIRRAA